MILMHNMNLKGHLMISNLRKILQKHFLDLYQNYLQSLLLLSIKILHKKIPEFFGMKNISNLPIKVAICAFLMRKYKNH
jgi:hypothetical protein